MPKIKLRDYLKKYKETYEKLSSNKQVTMKDAIAYTTDQQKLSREGKNLINQIQMVNGLKTIQNIVDKSFDLASKKNKSFNAKVEKAKFKNELFSNAGKYIFHFSKTDNVEYANHDKLKKIVSDLRIKTLADATNYGTKKLYERVAKKLPDIGVFTDKYNLVGNILPLEKMQDNLADVIESSDIDLDMEIEDTVYATDLTDEELINDSKDAILNDIAEMDNVKNNPEKLEELKAIKLAVAGGNDISSDFSSLRDIVEGTANERTKKFGENFLVEEENRIFEEVSVSGGKQPVKVAKPGMEKEAKEYLENKPMILTDKEKEGFKLALEQIRELGLNTKIGEEGTKVYAFSKLQAQAVVLNNILKQIDETNKKIEAQEKLIKENKDDAKAHDMEVELEKLKAEKQVATNNLFLAKADYNKEEAKIDGVLNTLDKYFGNVQNMNTNVDVSRNGAIPPKYRKNIIGTSQLNGLYYLYCFLENNNITVDDFINNPAKAYRGAIDNVFNSDDYLVTGNEESLDKQLDKVVYRDMTSKDFFTKSNFAGSIVRSLDFVSSVTENFKENSAVSKKLGHLAAELSDKVISVTPFGDNSKTTYENIIVTGGKNFPNLIADKYYDPITRTIVGGSDFSASQYMNENDVTPKEMLNNTKAIIDALNRHNEPDQPMYARMVANGVSEQLNNVIYALNNATLKYLQQYKIDPKNVTDPDIKLLCKAIEKPEEFLVEDMGYKNLNANKIYNGELQKKYAKLSTITYDANAVQNALDNIEIDVLEQEGKFDKQVEKYRKGLEKRVSKLLDNPTPENLEKVEKEYDSFHNMLATHANHFTEKYQNGLMPETFYLKRLEQIMAGAPLNGLNYFDNSAFYEHDEYIEMQLSNSNLKPTDEEIAASEKSIDDLIKEKEDAAREAAEEAYNNYLEKQGNEEEVFKRNFVYVMDKPYEEIIIKKDRPDGLKMELKGQSAIEGFIVVDEDENGVLNEEEIEEKTIEDYVRIAKKNADLAKEKELDNVSVNSIDSRSSISSNNSNSVDEEERDLDSSSEDFGLDDLGLEEEDKKEIEDYLRRTKLDEKHLAAIKADPTLGGHRTKVSIDLNESVVSEKSKSIDSQEKVIEKEQNKSMDSINI
ncbi:MAG: hypothetical protein K6A63_05200 [Acholeplasmatales bacterium]|nr:hypothetical protein [Acholeplasmatales bacterium]